MNLMSFHHQKQLNFAESEYAYKAQKKKAFSLLDLFLNLWIS